MRSDGEVPQNLAVAGVPHEPRSRKGSPTELQSPCVKLQLCRQLRLCPCQQVKILAAPRKNYHRQPAPVVVGTMFTSMQEPRFVTSSLCTERILARSLRGCRTPAPCAFPTPPIPCPWHSPGSMGWDRKSTGLPSCPCSRARQVGGWDVQWIAEDYHMGIKCFLMTLGDLAAEQV